jgi:hypothetical protein
MAVQQEAKATRNTMAFKKLNTVFLKSEKKGNAPHGNEH